MLLGRLSGPVSCVSVGRKPWIDVIAGPRLPARCSQWMPSSKKASPPAIVSSLRQSPSALNFRAIVVKCANTISPMTPSARSLRRRTGQRLVVVVLAHAGRRGQRGRARPARCGNPPYAGRPASPRARVCRRRAPAASGPGGSAAARRSPRRPHAGLRWQPCSRSSWRTPHAALERLRLGPFPAGVRAEHVLAQGRQVTAVDLRDETAAQEREAQGFGRHGHLGCDRVLPIDHTPLRRSA